MTLVDRAETLAATESPPTLCSFCPLCEFRSDCAAQSLNFPEPQTPEDEMSAAILLSDERKRMGRVHERIADGVVPVLNTTRTAREAVDRPRAAAGCARPTELSSFRRLRSCSTGVWRGLNCTHTPRFGDSPLRYAEQCGAIRLSHPSRRRLSYGRQPT